MGSADKQGKAIIEQMQSQAVAGPYKMTQDRLNALTILAEGKIPDKYIYKRPGKGGKTFRYVKHTWITKLLQDAFGMLWSYDISKTEIHPDGSATAIVTLTINVPLADGTFFSTHVSEVGAFEGPKDMSAAYKTASAVSRGLCKAVYRLFGIGAEFYGEEDAMTADDAWRSLLSYGRSKGVDKAGVVSIMKELGIGKESITDRFEEVFDRISGSSPSTMPEL